MKEFISIIAGQQPENDLKINFYLGTILLIKTELNQCLRIPFRNNIDFIFDFQLYSMHCYL